MQALQTINSRYCEPLYSVGCLPTSKLAPPPPTLFELNGTQPLSGSMETLVVTRLFLAKPTAGIPYSLYRVDVSLLTSC